MLIAWFVTVFACGAEKLVYCLLCAPHFNYPLISNPVEVVVVANQRRSGAETRGGMCDVRLIRCAKVASAYLQVLSLDSDELHLGGESLDEKSRSLRGKNLGVAYHLLGEVDVTHQPHTGVRYQVKYKPECPWRSLGVGDGGHEDVVIQEKAPGVPSRSFH